MKVVRGRVGRPSRVSNPQEGIGKFQLDTVIDESPVRLSNATFEPGARNHWHRHEIAQIIVISSGEGIVADREGRAVRLLPGDVMYVGAGEEHWHGASPHSFVTYSVLSLGSTEMLTEEVDDDEYARAWKIAESAAPPTREGDA